MLQLVYQIEKRPHTRQPIKQEKIVMLIDVLNMATGEFTKYNEACATDALIIAAYVEYNTILGKTELVEGAISLGFRDLAVMKDKTKT